ncbi:MAG: DUF805 domain-containing protein [Pseudomonadota bacterium]
MGPIDATIRCLTHPLTFAGRAPRSEYWWFTLFVTLAWLAAYFWTIWPIFGPALEALMAGADDETLGAIMTDGVAATLMTRLKILGLLMLYLLVAQVSVLVRRLHDIGRSGWWYWISLIPIVGPFILLIMMVMPSEGYRNDFGLPPKGTKRDAFRPSAELASPIPEVARSPIDQIRTAEGYKALRQARMGQ